MNVYNIAAKPDGSKELKIGEKLDLDDEYYAIASNSQD